MSPSPRLHVFVKVSGSHLEVLPRLFISMLLSLFRHFLCIRVLPIPCIFVTTNEGQVGPLWAKIGPLFKSHQTHLQHLDPRDWASVTPGMAGRPLAHATNLTTESHIVREFTFDIERLENTRVCKDRWTRIHIEWMLVPLRLLMDGLLQNHSTCGFQIRIPSDRPTRYKHTPTDMQTQGRPSVRTGRALLCLPNGTELMDMSMSTCKNHVSHGKQKSFMPFIVSSSLSFSLYPFTLPYEVGSSWGFFLFQAVLFATSARPGFRPWVSWL